MDEDRLLKNFLWWLRATVIALVCHGIAILSAAAIVMATGLRVAEKLQARLDFAREQLAIWYRP